MQFPNHFTYGWGITFSNNLEVSNYSLIFAAEISYFLTSTELYCGLDRNSIFLILNKWEACRILFILLCIYLH